MSRKQRDKKSQETSSVRTFYMVLGLVAVVGVGAVGYSVGNQVFSATATEPVDLGQVTDSALVELAKPVDRGDPDAKVLIIEFGDYQCPACQAFATTAEAQVKLNYIDTGKAKLRFYDFPLIRVHPNAFVAARAARCAGDQGAYWKFHDEIFKSENRNWTIQKDPVGALAGYAEALGMDRGEFESCVESDRFADVVSANRELAIRYGIPATPTILVLRSGSKRARALPNHDFETISKAVDAALAEQ